MNSDFSPIYQPSAVSSLKRRRVPVVAVHDGAASAPLIARARTQVEEVLSCTRQVRFHSWAFHHLEALDVRAMAGHLAEAAPLILLASADGRLPAHVQRWLDQSLVAQEHRAMLVALEDCEGPLCAFTVRLASRWGTDHLCAARLDADPQRQLVLGAVEMRLQSEIIEEAVTPDETPRRPLSMPKPATDSAPRSPLLITEPQLREHIRMRAYHLWLHAGCPHGQELDFWLRAEREFIERQSASSTAAAEHW